MLIIPVPHICSLWLLLKLKHLIEDFVLSAGLMAGPRRDSYLGCQSGQEETGHRF